ncbi:MAG: hypothetical protein ACYTEE_06830 [Planctomycetota bacterium]|jgi:hypothetical protein
MDKEKFERLFYKLTDATSESSRDQLSSKIKEQIPSPLPHHRGLDTINIMIDLRISRIAAAAAIIITVLIFASFLGGKGTRAENLFQDAKILIQYWLGGDKGQENIFKDSSNLLRRLVPEDKENVEYFGDIVEQGDSEAVLMYWKLDDGRYEVIFGDLQVGTLTADELLKAQGNMLKKKAN